MRSGISVCVGAQISSYSGVLRPSTRIAQIFLKTVEWTHTYISEDAQRGLRRWLDSCSDGTDNTASPT